MSHLRWIWKQVIVGMILNKIKIIGLTGGIGTGKSTVSKIIKNRGFPVIDADLIAREVVNIEEPAYLKIVGTFGKQILNDDGSIDRKKLGNIVFCDANSRFILNNIVHPQIYNKIKEKILEYSESNNIIFIDIPLLIEELDSFNKSDILFDEIWLVYADLELQLNRIIERDKTDYESAIRRVKAQMPIDEKLKHAHVIINNTGNMEELVKNVDNALKAFW